MTQAFNLSQFANKVDSSGQADASTGFTGTISTSNLPTVPTTKGGTGLTAVGTAGQVLKSNGSTLSWGNVAGTIAWQSVQTTGFTATSNYGYPCNTTSAAFTVTLPASPSAGDMISIIDYAGTSATNNITLATNGNKINGSTNNALISTSREGITIVYADATQGWIAVSDVYSSTNPLVQPYSADYIMVAGGGGGGSGSAGGNPSGGGGAGGCIAGTSTLTPGTALTIVLGSGGAQGSSGTNTTMTGYTTCIGGGYGASGDNGTGASGGSGGGSNTVSSVGGAGTSGQGNNGGFSATAFATSYPGSGGGGKGAVGTNASANQGGNGGVGTNWQSLGTYYAGGGGGGARSGSGGTGGLGGGGNGATGGSTTAGAANTGGGGGGNTQSVASSPGGSGVVIIRYLGLQKGSGGTITSSGGYTYHTFTTSGTYTA